MKQTSKKTQEKLTLNTQTMRRLSDAMSDDQLKEVIGGAHGAYEGGSRIVTGGC